MSFSYPDPLGLNPLVALLPKLGSVQDLVRFKPSFFARFEKVQAIKQAGGEETVQAEGVMIKEILDWLSENY